MRQKCEVLFLPAGRAVMVDKGSSLLQAARLAGLKLEAPCDGTGACGKCRVKAGGAISYPDKSELAILGATLEDGVRLACCAKIGGDIQVELMPEADGAFVTLTQGQSGDWPFDPSLRKTEINAGDEENCGSRAIAGNAQPFFHGNMAEKLRELAGQYREGQDRRSVVAKNGRILDWQTPAAIYAVALDIGTTSVVAELIDMADGRTVGTSSCLNPQAEFGGDVLTRIAFSAQNDGGTQILQTRIIAGINKLIDDFIDAYKVRQDEIYEVVAAGNTTMQHLLLGVSPHSLARSPYRPVFTGQLAVRPAEVGINIAPAGVITVLPAASAFVGADITAGLLAMGLHHSRKTVLFIDIGTNGEIVVIKDALMVGASAAAGPALEGMNISCGCRAAAGAVESVAIENDGQVVVKVIGDGAPTGLCGSGLLDLIAAMLRCGVLEESGRFAKPEKLPPSLASRFFVRDNKPAFAVAGGEAIYLTQKDVRQVQLAKGAITAAAGLLLQDMNIRFADLDEVLVAGAFGFHLRPASLVGIGLLPPECEKKIKFVGNTAKEGARAVVLNQQAGRDILQIAENLQVKELSLRREFQDAYVKNLAFPHLE